MLKTIFLLPLIFGLALSGCTRTPEEMLQHDWVCSPQFAVSFHTDGSYQVVSTEPATQGTYTGHYTLNGKLLLVGKGDASPLAEYQTVELLDKSILLLTNGMGNLYTCGHKR